MTKDASRLSNHAPHSVAVLASPRTSRPLAPFSPTRRWLGGVAGGRWGGRIGSDGSRDQLIFPIPELIAEITTYLTLEPGDVIATGTPEGVGSLSDGDTVEIEVEGVGTLEHTVRIP